MAPVIESQIVYSEVTAESVKLSWPAAKDDVSPSSVLEYRLVKARSRADVATLEKALSRTGPDIVRDYDSNMLSWTVRGLSDGSTYAFAVLVRDAGSNTALYDPVLVTTDDTTSPRAGSGLVFSDVSATGFNLTWGAASDSATHQADLEYRLVRATSIDSVDAVDEIENIVAPDPRLLMDWTPNRLSFSVSGLLHSTSYALGLLVRDQSGNVAMYPAVSQRTSDPVPPGTGSALQAVAGAFSVALSWGRAADNVTPASALQYRVVSAQTHLEIDTVAEAAALSGAAVARDFEVDVLATTISNLSDNTSYAFAVLVRDEAGNLNLYPPVGVVTADGTPPPTGFGNRGEQ